MAYRIILGTTVIARITGMEAAYEAFYKTCELAELIGQSCRLVTEKDDEVIAEYKYEEVILC